MFKNAKMIHFEDLTNNPKNCWKEKYVDVKGYLFVRSRSVSYDEVCLEFYPHKPNPAKGISAWFKTSLGKLIISGETSEMTLITSHSIFTFRYEKEEEGN